MLALSNKCMEAAKYLVDDWGADIAAANSVSVVRAMRWLPWLRSLSRQSPARAVSEQIWHAHVRIG